MNSVIDGKWGLGSSRQQYIILVRSNFSNRRSQVLSGSSTINRPFSSNFRDGVSLGWTLISVDGQSEDSHCTTTHHGWRKFRVCLVVMKRYELGLAGIVYYKPFSKSDKYSLHHFSISPTYVNVLPHDLMSISCFNKTVEFICVMLIYG